MTERHVAFTFLGQTVIDQLTGLKGIVQYIDEFHSGTIHCSVQPKGDGDKVPDGYNIDWQQLVLQVDGPSIEVTPVPDPTDYLGKRVKDKITDFEGVATHRHTHVNGCETYYVEGKYNPTVGKSHMFRVFAMDLIDLSPKVEEPKPVETPLKRTGCASVKAERF